MATWKMSGHVTPGYVFKDGQTIPDSELEQQEKGQSIDPASSSNAQASSSSSRAGPGQAAPASSSNSTMQQIQQQTSSVLSSITGSSSTASDAPSSPANANKLATLTEGQTTDSHALAAADHDEKGVAQEQHFEAEVRDLGWVEQPEDVAQPLVGGMPNDELWMLVRRFNKQMYHVKATNTWVPGGLDLNIADEDEFSPDKLRANVERLYMTVIVGLISFGKHIARLRSWREPRRTGAFLAVYAIAWIFDFIVPTLFTTLTILILVPQARDLMFPPAPIALINSKTGGIQSPKAGVLGSHDSLTGAPEKHKGEAVEQEANNFVAGIGTIALSSATGKHEQGDPESDPVSKSVPDPTDLAKVGVDAKSATAGGHMSKKHDKTKQPMEEVMWTQMRPIMHVVGDIADGWERFGNALSPTSPFSKVIPKLKLAAIVAPAIAISAATSSYMFVKMAMFFVGFGFFADPIIWRGLEMLNKKFPHWQKILEIRNTILKGVPTNAQLTVTLLRIGEANKAPLPPPPRADGPPPDHPAELDTNDLTVDASHEEIQDAIHADDQPTGDEQHEEEPKKKHGSKVMGFLKGTTKVGVETKLGADNVRAAVGSVHARNHLGAVPKPADQKPSGPVDFKARYQGKKGWVYINTSATIPCVSFSKHQSKGTGEDTENSLDPVWSIPIEDVRELKKVGGFGWKAKLVVGWATDKSVVDGLEIVDKAGNTTKLTAIVLREELFNRLVAMGGQKWESW